MHLCRIIHRLILVTLLSIGLLTVVEASMGGRQSSVPGSQAETENEQLAELHQAAKSAHAVTRIDAIRRIATDANPASMDTLIEALDDQEVAIREMAAIGLARIGRAESVPALVAAMHDADPRVRSQAAVAIVSIGPADGAMDEFFAGLGAPGQGIKTPARNGKSRAAVRGNGARSAPAINAAEQGDSSLVMSKKVLRALYSANPDMRDTLLAALNDTNPVKRYAAAYALSVSNDPNVIEKFNEALVTRDQVVISGAYEFYLARHKEEARTGLLDGINQFDDPDLILAMSRSGDGALEAAARTAAARQGIRLDNQ